MRRGRGNKAVEALPSGAQPNEYWTHLARYAAGQPRSARLADELRAYFGERIVRSFRLQRLHDADGSCVYNLVASGALTNAIVVKAVYPLEDEFELHSDTLVAIADGFPEHSGVNEEGREMMWECKTFTEALQLRDALRKSSVPGLIVGIREGVSS